MIEIARAGTALLLLIESDPVGFKLLALGLFGIGLCLIGSERKRHD